MSQLRNDFGDIDIYLFDQLLRGRIIPGMRVLDAGCGTGRNLMYLLKHGYEVAGCDCDPAAIATVRALAARLAPHLPFDRFRLEPIEHMSFPDASSDVVLANAVLHFAADDRQFNAMVSGLWRVLAPNGLLFARLASSIGIESEIETVNGRRHRLPDGTERYRVDEPLLMKMTASLGGELLDPIKTTVVQDQRAMTTWVIKKIAD